MRIQEIEIQTTDIAGVKHFYNGVLALPVLRQSDTAVSFTVGHSILSFVHNPLYSGVHHFAFLLPHNKSYEAYNWVAARLPVLAYNSTSAIADFVNWNAQAFYFHDNHRNILEFIVHHDLPQTSDAPFTPAAILGICEIGIAVDDVAESCRDFNDKFGIPFFQKGPNLQDFAVMGTEEALLIISKKGRGWVPTQQPAEAQYLKLVLQLEGSTKEILFDWW